MSIDDREAKIQRRRQSDVEAEQFFSLNLGGIPIEEFNKPSARSQSRYISFRVRLQRRSVPLQRGNDPSATRSMLQQNFGRSRIEHRHFELNHLVVISVHRRPGWGTGIVANAGKILVERQRGERLLVLLYLKTK